jgi:predicted MFS family arabinose efflux permease
MGLQALSGVAKDLTKMSSKSAVKTVAGDGGLFRLVAILTGSKNALKGVGFFVGGALLSGLGFDGALWTMVAALAVTVAALIVFLNEDIGRSKRKAPLRSLMSKSTEINRLSAARFFLFGSRDIWFVVALPVFLADTLGWSHEGVGAFLAAWVIGYGIVQSSAPRLLAAGGRASDEVAATRRWGVVLAVVSAAIAALVLADVARTVAIVGGLIVFGAVFAMNSALHSFLVLAYASDDEVALDVGFYYSANAAGRLVGTLLSGLLFLIGDLSAALWGSTVFVVVTWLLTLRLPPIPASSTVNLAEVSGGD